MIFAETKRLLETALAFVASSVLTINLPLDTTLKGVLIRLQGYTTYTFSSAVSAKETSIMDNIVSRIIVEAGGSRQVKMVKPHMVQLQALYENGMSPERRASAGAAAAYQNNPTADSGFVFGTTTQSTTVVESLYLPFECIVAGVAEKSATWLDTRGLASCQLKLITGALAGFDRSGNGTFTVNALSFEVTTVEAPGFVQKEKLDWKQTVDVDTLSAAVTDRKMDLPRQGRVTGISLFVIQDSSGADSTVANRYKPNQNSIDTVKIRKDGREIWSGTYRSIFSDNQTRGKMNAVYASNISRRDGWGYIPFLHDRRLGTALDVRDANSFELFYTTRAADATYNIYPLEVSVQTDSLVNVG